MQKSLVFKLFMLCSKNQIRFCVMLWLYPVMTPFACFPSASWSFNKSSQLYFLFELWHYFCSSGKRLKKSNFKRRKNLIRCVEVETLLQLVVASGDDGFIHACSGDQLKRSTLARKHGINFRRVCVSYSTWLQTVVGRL